MNKGNQPHRTKCNMSMLSTTPYQVQYVHVINHTVPSVNMSMLSTTPYQVQYVHIINHNVPSAICPCYQPHRTKCNMSMFNHTVPSAIWSMLSTTLCRVICVYDNWRASEVSETLSGVYKFELIRYVYIYICMEIRVP